MKSCIFLLTLLGFVRLCFASQPSKGSITDNSDYVCLSNVSRRKRADAADYTRWRPSLEVTSEFLVKVLDDDLPGSAKPVVQAVNIMPMSMAKHNTREKIIVGGPIIPPRKIRTTTNSKPIDVKDYTRFVPPTEAAITKLGETLGPTVFVAPIKLSEVAQPPSGALQPPVQMQFAPQVPHAMRDESPPDGPRFVPHSAEDIRLARQYAPIVPVVFHKKTDTPFSRSAELTQTTPTYAPLLATHKRWALPRTSDDFTPTRVTEVFTAPRNADFTPARTDDFFTPPRTAEVYTPRRTAADYIPSRIIVDYTPPRAVQDYTPPRTEEYYSPSRFPDMEDGRSRLDVPTRTSAEHIDHNNIDQEEHTTTPRRTKPVSDPEIKNYNMFNYDTSDVSSTSKVKDEEIVFYSDNNRRNIEEIFAFYDDDREDGGGGGGGGGGGKSRVDENEEKFRSEFVSSLPKFDLVEPEMYDSSHPVVSTEEKNDPVNHVTSTIAVEVDVVENTTVELESSTDNNSTSVSYEETITDSSETSELEQTKNVCSMIKLRNMSIISPRTLPEITAQLKKWAEASPMARWVDITDGNLTIMENPIYMMIVDDPRNGQFVDAKLTVMIVAGIQGRDHHAVAAAMYILYQLIERSEAHSELLSKYRFWIIPVFNPDGYDYSMTFPKRRQWAKNLRQDWDDCNGRASCRACMTRGVRCTVQPCYGVNLDRNFEYQWIPSVQLKTDNPCGSMYAGPRQLSEVETRALTYYLENTRPPIYIFLAFKEGDTLGVMYPYSHTKKRRAFDESYRQRAVKAAAAAQSISGRPYVAGQTSEFLPLYAGGIEDWVDGHLSIDNTYTIMMYRPNDKNKSPAITESAIQEAYAAMDTLLLISTRRHSTVVSLARKATRAPDRPKRLKFRGHGPRNQFSYVLALITLLLHLLSKFMVYR